MASLEPFLAKQPGVSAVSIDGTTSVAYVTYDPQTTSVEDLCALLDRYGYACDGVDQATTS